MLALHAHLLLHASPAVSFSPLSHESLYKSVSFIYLLSLASQKTLTWFVIPGSSCDYNVLLMHNQLVSGQLLPSNNSLSSHIHSLSICMQPHHFKGTAEPSLLLLNSCFPKMQGIYKVLWGTLRCYPTQNSLKTIFSYYNAEQIISSTISRKLSCENMIKTK